MDQPAIFNPRQILLRIAAVIAVVEFCVMRLLAWLPVEAAGPEAALIDAGLLAAISSPLLFLWIVRPFVRERDRALGEMGRLANTDSLTQLANRREFDRVLTLEHARHARTGGELSLIMVDIDHFKAFNDHYGHLGGDDCLRAVAAAIAGCIARPADLAARYGGEEFVCLLPDTDSIGALAIAEKLRREVETLAMPHATSATAAHVTVSAGLATMRCGADNSGEILVGEADRLLYLAKERGRNRVEFGMRYATVMPEPGQFVRLVWKPAYNSGNYLIDVEHQRLFAAANQLLDGMLAGRPMKELLAEGLVLIDEAVKHFDDEMRILEKLGYQKIDEHRREHTRLIERALEQSRRASEGRLKVGELFEFLVFDVIARHMLGSDRDYFALTHRPEAASIV